MKKSENQFNNTDKKIPKNYTIPGAFIPLNKTIYNKLGLECTFMLSMLIDKYSYFESVNMLDEQNGFFNLEEDRLINIDLSLTKQKKYINILKGLGLIATKLVGLPSKLHFYINIDLIKKFTKYENKIEEWLCEKDTIEYKDKWRPRNIKFPVSWDSNSISSWIDLKDFFDLDLFKILNKICKKYGGQVSHDMITHIEKITDVHIEKINAKHIEKYIDHIYILNTKYTNTKLDLISFIKIKDNYNISKKKCSNISKIGNNENKDKNSKKNRNAKTSGRNKIIQDESKQIQSKQKSKTIPKNRQHRKIPNLIKNTWNAAPTTTTHRPDTKQWDQMISNFKQMIDGTFWQSKSWDIDFKEKIPKNIQNKKWTIDELKQAINNLILHTKDGYWPESNKNSFKNLKNSLYNSNTRKSHLIAAFVNKPRPISENIYKPKEKELQLMYAIVSEYFCTNPTDEQKYNTAINSLIVSLKKYYHDKVKNAPYSQKYHFPNSTMFCERYIDYIDHNHQNAQPNKIGITSYQFSEFIEEYMPEY